MSRIRTYKTEAVVLRQTSLGEADRILTLYTPDMGAVRAVAKGIRRTTSRLGGHLELLNRVSVSLSQGRNLDVVNEAQVLQSFGGLRDDLRSLSWALYVAELVDRFSEERSPNYEVYLLLVETVTCLEAAPESELHLRYFELRLVDLAGFRPELHRCVECQTALEPDDHLFSASLGGIVCLSCRSGTDRAQVPVSLKAMKILRFLQRAQGVDAVAGLRVARNEMAEIERMLRVYIRFLLERDLKSAEFMSLVTSSER